jgi:hypothetical protein
MGYKGEAFRGKHRKDHVRNYVKPFVDDPLIARSFSVLFNDVVSCYVYFAASMVDGRMGVENWRNGSDKEYPRNIRNLCPRAPFFH